MLRACIAPCENIYVVRRRRNYCIARRSLAAQTMILPFAAIGRGVRQIVISRLFALLQFAAASTVARSKTNIPPLNPRLRSVDSFFIAGSVLFWQIMFVRYSDSSAAYHREPAPPPPNPPPPNPPPMPPERPPPKPPMPPSHHSPPPMPPPPPRSLRERRFSTWPQLEHTYVFSCTVCVRVRSMIASDLNFNVCRLHTGHFERLYSDIIAMTTGSRTNISTIRIGSHNGASST